MLNKIHILGLISIAFLFIAVYERTTYGSADAVSVFGAMAAIFYIAYLLRCLKECVK